MKCCSGCAAASLRRDAHWMDRHGELGEAVPDPKNTRCIIGSLLVRSTARFRLFRARRFQWKLMERYREGGDHANMLPTGRYLSRSGRTARAARARSAARSLER